MLTPRSERCEVLRLDGGRRLAYTEIGPADGTPVIYCHGAIGTPVDGSVDLARITESLGVRYITPYRPGIGGSDAHPGRRVADFAQDVAQLADALALEHFSAVGVSAGGPYALAVGYALRSRVTRVAACSSLSPLWAPHRTPGIKRRVRAALGLLAAHPGLVTAVGDTVLPAVARHPEVITRVIRANASPQERGHLDSCAERGAATRSFLEATAGGVGGLIADYLTYSTDWGFAAAEVYNEVQLWHGGADPLVPVEHALQLAATLPHCEVYIDPTQGHHFFRGSLEPILSALTGRAQPEARLRRSIPSAAVGR